MHDGKVYFTDWTSKLYAHDFATGKRIYAVQVSTKPLDATPFVTEDRIYVGDGATLLEPGDGAVLYTIERKTGRMLWSRVLDSHDKAHLYGSPVVVEGIVVIGVAGFELMLKKDDYIFRGSIVGLDAADGRQR